VELFPLGLPSDPKDDPELLALYTFKELSYAQSKPNPLQTLAGLFSAKEAIIKCSKQKKNFADIEILPDENGRPYTPDFLISISHSVDYVVAIATPLLRNLNESKPSGNGRQPKIEQFNDGIARQDHHNSMPVNLSRWLNFTIAVTVFVLACLEIFRAFK
jgi:hypothetical protein